MAETRRRKRVAILATGLVLVVGAAGATVVYLIGSAQRRDDRAAYLRYERAVLVPIRDGGQLVQQEMKPSLGDLSSGSITPEMARERARAWRLRLRSDKTQLVAIPPPKFLRGIEVLWGAAMDAYLQVPALFEEAAGQTGAERTSLIQKAADAGDRADKLFDNAARAMQFHRKRLGLGVTHSLPNPGPSE